MRLRTTAGTLAAAIPVVLLATAMGPLTTTAAAAAKAPAAAYVLNADTGRFTTGAKAAALAAPRVFTGTATTLRILTAPGQAPVIADATMADSPQKEARAAWAASPGFADLSWPDLGGTYRVYKDDRLIATTTGHSFRDTHVTPGSEPFYQISNSGAKGGTWGLATTIPTTTSTAGLTATARSIEAKAKKYDYTKIVWRSFISQKWAYVPSWAKKVSGCKYAGGYKYAGDNRNFSSKVSGPTFRAGFVANVSWKHKDVVSQALTGATHVYKTSNSRLVDTRKASTKKIKFKTMTKFNGKTRSVHASVEATDPFCKYGGIGANVNLRLSRSGDFYADGNYKQAPSHELYLYGYNGKKHSTKAVHQSKMADIKCLFKAACETAKIGNNGGY